MKRIRILQESVDEYYRSDSERIQKIFASKGYSITLEEARALWDMYSDSMCAGWMGLPDDDETVFALVQSYFEDAAPESGEGER